ncbi:hypothetical protein ACJX0J_036173 [Zea mays]
MDLTLPCLFTCTNRMYCFKVILVALHFKISSKLMAHVLPLLHGPDVVKVLSENTKIPGKKVYAPLFSTIIFRDRNIILAVQSFIKYNNGNFDVMETLGGRYEPLLHSIEIMLMKWFFFADLI